MTGSDIFACTGSAVAAAATPTPRERIALVLPSLLPWGGVERLMASQARELLSLGFRVDMVFLNESHDLTGVVPRGTRVFNLAAPRLRYGLRPLMRYLLREKPDALHVAMWPLTSLAVLAHRLTRSASQIVISDHNPLSIQYAEYGRLHNLAMRLSIALTYPFASARVGVSAAVADDLSRISHISRSRFDVIHNPITLGTGGRTSDAESAWKGWRGKRIITVGRMKAQKNHALLIRSFKALLETVDARLMILGVGELANQTAELVRSEELTGYVLMPGQVEDPTPFYESADLFVLSSNYEGFGNVIVEALACGLPVVSTDCPGGPAEILEGGRYGRLVPVGDLEGLARAMCSALSEPRHPDVQRSRAQDFALSGVTKKFESLLVRSRATPASPPTRR